jgi:hypothetical protein
MEYLQFAYRQALPIALGIFDSGEEFVAAWISAMGAVAAFMQASG